MGSREQLVRKSFHLDPGQDRKLGSLSRRTGLSRSEILRRAISAYALDNEYPDARVLEAALRESLQSLDHAVHRLNALLEKLERNLFPDRIEAGRKSVRRATREYFTAHPEELGAVRTLFHRSP